MDAVGQAKQQRLDPPFGPRAARQVQNLPLGIVAAKDPCPDPACDHHVHADRDKAAQGRLRLGAKDRQRIESDEHREDAEDRDDHLAQRNEEGPDALFRSRATRHDPVAERDGQPPRAEDHDQTEDQEEDRQGQVRAELGHLRGRGQVLPDLALPAQDRRPDRPRRFGPVARCKRARTGRHQFFRLPGAQKIVDLRDDRVGPRIGKISRQRRALELGEPCV